MMPEDSRSLHAHENTLGLTATTVTCRFDDWTGAPYGPTVIGTVGAVDSLQYVTPRVDSVKYAADSFVTIGNVRYTAGGYQAGVFGWAAVLWFSTPHYIVYGHDSTGATLSEDFGGIVSGPSERSMALGRQVPDTLAFKIIVYPGGADSSASTVKLQTAKPTYVVPGLPFCPNWAPKMSANSITLTATK